jgi:histidine triad (HIT) family protein
MFELACDLCGIADREPERVIHQTEQVTSFLSDKRLTPGHALVIPNAHVEVPWELSDEELRELHLEGDRLSIAMLGSFALGVERWLKTRPYVPEGEIKRNHLHLHILPSSPGEPLYDPGVLWGNAAAWSPLVEKGKARMLALLRPPL